jgi:hypothetical protein
MPTLVVLIIAVMLTCMFALSISFVANWEQKITYYFGYGVIFTSLSIMTICTLIVGVV